MAEHWQHWLGEIKLADHLKLVNEGGDAAWARLRRSIRIKTAERPTRQVDVLARFALARVPENGALSEKFKTDAGIEDFWKQDDASRVAMWGMRLDLTAIA